MNFSDDKKIAAFDELAELYYNKNFGTASKSEIDILMFKFFVESFV